MTNWIFRAFILCCLTVLVQTNAIADAVTDSDSEETFYLGFPPSVEKPSDTVFAKSVSKILSANHFTPRLNGNNVIFGEYKGHVRFEIQYIEDYVTLTFIKPEEYFNQKWARNSTRSLLSNLMDTFGLHFKHLLRMPLPSTGELPSDQEFILAAKRVFFKRHYEYRVVDSTTVEGHIRDTYRFQIRITDIAVEIESTGDLGVEEEGGVPKIFRYLRNLERDLKYELGKYFL